MSASVADVTDTDATAPPPAAPEPPAPEPGTDEVVQLEERRRDAYRVG
jgi:hypothetical protein